MNYFLAISGSPSKLSRSNFLLHGLAKRLETYKSELRIIHAVELEPFARDAPQRLGELVATLQNVRAVLLITPVPSEAWTGFTKALLQLLPDGAFQSRPVLLIGTGGLASELPDLERTTNRELSRLSGRLALSSIHVGPKDWVFSSSRPPWLTSGTETRVNRALDRLHTLATDPVIVSDAA